jgi:uncharacterized membrane protein YhhN
MIMLIISFISAVLDWIVVLGEIKWLEYIFKPLTMVFLILWVFRKLPPEVSTLGWIILLGLVLSLFGDIFLMLPGDWFLAGLIAFLLAHIAYSVGFNLGGVKLTVQSLLIGVVIFVIAAGIYFQLRNGLRNSGNEGLILPVTIYVLIISFMLWSASTSNLRDEWLSPAAILVTAGAGLFFLSDAVLGWNRFVREIPRGNLIVIMAYHAAQYLISFGVLYRLEALSKGLFG